MGLPFPPRNLPIKFGTNPSTIVKLSWSQTDTQTHKPTPVKHTPSLSRGEQPSNVFAPPLFLFPRQRPKSEPHHGLLVMVIEEVFTHLASMKRIVSPLGVADFFEKNLEPLSESDQIYVDHSTVYGQLLRAKFHHAHRCKMSPLRGENSQNQLPNSRNFGVCPVCR